MNKLKELARSLRISRIFGGIGLKPDSYDVARSLTTASILTDRDGNVATIGPDGKPTILKGCPNLALLKYTTNTVTVTVQSTDYNLVPDEYGFDGGLFSLGAGASKPITIDTAEVKTGNVIECLIDIRLSFSAATDAKSVRVFLEDDGWAFGFDEIFAQTSTNRTFRKMVWVTASKDANFAIKLANETDTTDIVVSTGDMRVMGYKFPTGLTSNLVAVP